MFHPRTVRRVEWLLHELPSPYRVLRPIPITVRQMSDGRAIVRLPIVELEAEGSSEVEAIEALQRAMIDGIERPAVNATTHRQKRGLAPLIERSNPVMDSNCEDGNEPPPLPGLRADGPLSPAQAQQLSERFARERGLPTGAELLSEISSGMYLSAEERRELAEAVRESRRHG